MSEEAREILKLLEDMKEPDGSIIIETPTGKRIRIRTSGEKVK